MYQTIITESDGAVGIITLANPDQSNAIDELMVGELTTALSTLENAPEIKAIVLSALGDTFCAGISPIWGLLQQGQSTDERLRDAHYLAHLFATLNELQKPTVARIQGPVLGAGIGLIAACDIAIATYDAELSFTEGKFGSYSASIIAPYVLSATGPRFARRYMLSGERFSAAEAYRIGLMHEIVPDEDQLDDAIGEIVDNLLSMDIRKQRELKTLIREVSFSSIDDTTIERTVFHAAELCGAQER